MSYRFTRPVAPGAGWKQPEDGGSPGDSSLSPREIGSWETTKCTFSGFPRGTPGLEEREYTLPGRRRSRCTACRKPHREPHQCTGLCEGCTPKMHPDYVKEIREARRYSHAVPKPGEAGVGPAEHPYLDDPSPRYVRLVPDFRSVAQSTAATAPPGEEDSYAAHLAALQRAEGVASSSGLRFREDRMGFADDFGYHFRDHKVRHTVDYRSVHRPPSEPWHVEEPEVDWGSADWHRYVGDSTGEKAERPSQSNADDAVSVEAELWKRYTTVPPVDPAPSSELGVPDPAGCRGKRSWWPEWTSAGWKLKVAVVLGCVAAAVPSGSAQAAWGQMIPWWDFLTEGPESPCLLRAWPQNPPACQCPVPEGDLLLTGASSSGTGPPPSWLKPIHQAIQDGRAAAHYYLGLLWYAVCWIMVAWAMLKRVVG